MLHFSRRIPFPFTLLMVLFWQPLFSITHAQETNRGQPIEIPDVTRGSLLYRTNQIGQYVPAPTLLTKVHIDVTGMIARGVVNQQFTNPGTEWAEGVYVFPLPETAAVDHIRIIIGERRIEGMIQERDLAKKTYTSARKQGRRASLLEQERPNMFTASVANIGPGETIAIEIEYQETLRFDQGRFTLRFPLVVGPRYIPGVPISGSQSIPDLNGTGWAQNTDQVRDASRITPWVQHPDDGLMNPVSLRISLSPGFPLSQLTSRYHKIVRTQSVKGRYTITLNGQHVPSYRDFELLWKPAVGQTPQAAVFTQTQHGEAYSLIMVLPPTEHASDYLRESREVIFVIDTSGSMHGLSIEQAKAAVTEALGQLTNRDRVNIIQFNTKTDALYSSAREASPHTILKATQYVAELKAEGGTEMLPALRKALQQEEETDRLRQVIFITDGQIGNERELFQAVREQLRHSRLFTIGIGSAPNSYFMRKAAEFGGGTFTYIGKITEVQERMGQFFQKLENPVMFNIEVRNPNRAPMEQVPERVLDLYKGEPVMFAIKTTKVPEELTIAGKVGQISWEKTLTLNAGEQRDGIAIHWARQKIESLMNQQIRNQHTDTIRPKIIKLALRHHLVSRYTSLVAVDITPVRSPTQRLHPHSIKTNLPHGQNYAAIFGLARGATPKSVHLLIGLICLILAYGLYRKVRHPA